MTSLERKMEEVKEKFKRATPIRQTFYGTSVYGNGPYGKYEDDAEAHWDEILAWQGKDD